MGIFSAGLHCRFACVIFFYKSEIIRLRSPWARERFNQDEDTPNCQADSIACRLQSVDQILRIVLKVRGRNKDTKTTNEMACQGRKCRTMFSTTALKMLNPQAISNIDRSYPTVEEIGTLNLNNLGLRGM